MLLNATNQPKSIVELSYMCPRGLSGPPTVNTEYLMYELYSLNVLINA